MKKTLKRIIIVLAVLFVILKGMEWWLEHNFSSRINSNPDRAYNIDYEDFDLHTGFKRNYLGQGEDQTSQKN